MKAKIKVGSHISQDFGSFYWPECKPPRTEYVGEDYEYEAKDPDMIFDVEWSGRWWDCCAEGYGYPSSETNNHYGNGSIFAFGEDSIEIIE